MPLDPIRLAREFIDLPSLTGEEGPFAERLATLLEGLGFRIERQEVAPGRANLLATSGERPRVLLSSHLDTVPPFFASSETATRVAGRGACDTKGIIAAMVAAAEGLRSEGAGDFGMLFVVGEETDSIGAKRANEWMKDRGIELLINGEPTEGRFVRASKGALTALLRFDGKAAHSAYPERGDSAIVKLAGAVGAIYGSEWGSDPEMGVGTPNVGVVRGGEKANIIPDAAEAECIFRIVEPVGVARGRLERLVAPFGGRIAKSHGNDPVRMAVPRGAASVVVAYNTDVPHLHALGRPILFGPGSILEAHSATESIGKEELSAAVGIYRGLVRDYLKGSLELDG